MTPALGAAKARKESWRLLRCCPHSDFHGAKDKFQQSVPPGIFAVAHLAKPAWKVEAKAAKAKEAKVKAKEAKAAKAAKEAKEAKEKAKEQEKARARPE